MRSNTTYSFVSVLALKRLVSVVTVSASISVEASVQGPDRSRSHRDVPSLITQGLCSSPGSVRRKSLM